MSNMYEMPPFDMRRDAIRLSSDLQHAVSCFTRDITKPLPQAEPTTEEIVAVLDRLLNRITRSILTFQNRLAESHSEPESKETMKTFCLHQPPTVLAFTTRLMDANIAYQFAVKPNINHGTAAYITIADSDIPVAESFLTALTEPESDIEHARR